MRVLFVYKYLTMGGVETVFRARLKGLTEAGIQAGAWFLADGPGRDMFDHDGASFWIGSPHDLVRHVDRAHPDVLCTVDTEEIFPHYAAMPGPPRLIVECHSPYRENRVYLRWLGRLPVESFWVPSQFQAHLIQASLGRLAPVRVIPNPLQASYLKPISGFRAPPGGPKIGWVGRLDDVKNWRMLIRVAQEVLLADSRPELWMVGRSEGPVSDRNLYELVRRKGLLARFRWFQSLPADHMPAWFDLIRDSGGLVISTSRHESFGLSVAEAMARECAVLVPDAGPFPEYIRDGEQGVLYPPGSVRVAAQRATTLLADSAARQQIGERARKSAVSEFAPSVVLPVLIKALQDAVGSAL